MDVWWLPFVNSRDYLQRISRKGRVWFFFDVGLVNNIDIRQHEWSTGIVMKTPIVVFDKSEPLSVWFLWFCFFDSVPENKTNSFKFSPEVQCDPAAFIIEVYGQTACGRRVRWPDLFDQRCLNGVLISAGATVRVQSRAHQLSTQRPHPVSWLRSLNPLLKSGLTSPAVLALLTGGIRRVQHLCGSDANPAAAARSCLSARSPWAMPSKELIVLFFCLQGAIFHYQLSACSSCLAVLFQKS